MELWDEVKKFHGHECMGLAWGYRVGLFAIEKLGVDRSSDEELVAIVENDSCAIDGIQVVTGCTFGKGNLIFRDYGKHVYTFFKRSTGEGIRITRKKGIKTKDILSAEGEELFEISAPEESMPKKARINGSINCSMCGEGTMETRIHILKGKFLCTPCYERILAQ